MRVVAAMRPPARPARSSKPNSTKLLGAGGQAGRKSGVIGGPVGRKTRRATVSPFAADDETPAARAATQRDQGRIFSPDGPLARSRLTRSSRETPSHITSDAITSAE